MSNNEPRKSESWLAFELNILRRLEFKSISLPNAESPRLGEYLKHWDVNVTANSILQSNFIDLKAAIENEEVSLSEEDVDLILEDAYVPQFELKNPALKNWFGETDSWWFDNVRSNIERLTDPMKKALALSLVFRVGDYVLSFDEKTRRLRQPFSNVFKRCLGIIPAPIKNNHENSCHNKNSKEFIAENYTDLMFLRLPHPRSIALHRYLGNDAWREEWLRGSDKIWDEIEKRQNGQLGSNVETKAQYLTLLEDLFRTALHVKKWAIIHNENNFVSTQDVVESIGKVRRVETIYTKDFSELTGTKAVMIVA